MNTFLISLLADRAKEILGVAAADGSSHREVAMMGEYIGADYHERFLVELLQNANDQAIHAGLRNAVVTVVRKRDLLAVANQGQPLNEAGVRALTSLGLSGKDPNELIGNKGIGFKAVFEVTRAPEIYSAIDLGKTFWAEDSVSFCLSSDVFRGEVGAARLDRLVAGALAAKPEDARILGNESEASRKLAEEIRAAAPFKFPIEISRDQAGERFDKITDLPADAQALVVLPLLGDEKTTRAVEKAIDELLADDGAMILFLDGIGQLRVIDRARGLNVTFRKTWSHITDPPPGDARHSVLSISRTSGGLVASTTEWHVMASMYGGPEHPEQARALNAAAKNLPGQRYDGVDHIPVKVALPRNSGHANGRICIGLPTLDSTGTLAWIHSHFFGNISRKGVDLHGNGFNRLLFGEALRLHELLIAQLKITSSLEDRRLATLAFARSTGPLGDALFVDGGQAMGAVVLLADGESFEAAGRVLLIDQAGNADLAGKIASASSWGDHGPKLPDPVLLRVAPDLLLALSKHAGNAWKEADVLLVRGTDGLAPVERAARAFRDEGPEFWEPFLTYCLSLDPTLGRIRPLAIIPVAGGRLVRADDGVFLPLPSGGSQASEDPEDEDVPQDIIAELPPDLAGRLNTVDTTCLRIRQPNSREFTEFGGKISPISSTGLIRRTRLFELVNNAVIPAIDRLGTRDEDLTLGLRLLKLAARLMHRMKDKSRRRVADDKLKVPTADPTYPEGWSWAPAIECYFGEGWLGGRHGELLHHVYGARKCALLAPWEKVALHVLPDPREEWTKIFRDLGVKARPRILSKAAADFRPPLRLQGRKLVVEPDARCPIQGGEPYWQGYLNSYRDRPTNVLSNGYQYTFDHLTWIDGLDEEHAVATVELMLGEPGMYSTDAALTCRSDRADRPGTDVSASPLPSLWVHALRTEDWASIPADNGAAFCPSECWILRVPQSAPRPKRYESLRCVPAKWLGGEPILSAIGVEDISDPATIDAVARELDRLARHARANPERTGRNLAILAEDLYERLQRRIGNDDPKAGRPKAITMLPLLRAGCLVGVPIAEITGAYYPDDPERAAFVPDFAGKLQWPFSRRRGIAGVTRALRRWLGGRVEAVCLTSEATIETGFQAAGEPMVFMDWLREKFSEDHRQIRTDFGCLIAYAGLRETNPDKTTFQKHWSAFERATLVTGEFRHHPETRVFIQTAGIGQVEFQVAESLSPTETLAELWRVVEASYEDAWRLYCARLGDGAAAAAAFLRSKGIHEREREEVEEAIQVGTGSRFDKIRAATHAILAAGGRLGSKEDFAANWELRSKTTSLLTDWLGNDLTSERIEKALASPEEEGASREVLAHARVSIATWQNSLEALNEPRYRFQSTLQSWEQIRTQLVCTLKVALARQTDTDLSAGEIFLRKLDVLAAPTGVLESPPHLPTIRAVLLDAAERCDLEALGNRPSDFVRRCLATLREASVVAAEEWTTPKDVPDRDVREYRQGLERERIRQATERCRLYVEIAAELAPEQGENLDAATFTSVGKLPRLLDAFWANRFSFMPEFRRELQIRAPLTDGRMQSKGAFSTQLTPHEVRGLFFPPPGLGETKSAPPRKLSAVGVDFDETDLLRQLRKDGPLGLAVAAAAQQPSVDLTSLGGNRETLPAITRRPESDGRRRSRTRSGAIQESEADRDLNGKIGEIFVYEWLKALNLPDFDPECWISTNRCAYGGYPDGNDSAGYDFRIVDTDGRLSSRKGTHCLLEVKATSGDGSDPFKISENEWQQARDAHHSKGDQQYLIVRVAYVRMKAPQIVDILRDPYELMIQQKLRIFGTDLTAQAGRRI